MTNKLKLLIVDDEQQIRQLLISGMPSDQFDYIESESAAEGLRLAKSEHPDLIILDLGLPDFDGIQFIKNLREWSLIPVLVLSAREDEVSKVKALDLGANDYVTKPFSLPELLARVRAILRANSTKLSASETYSVGAIKINFETREVLKGSDAVHLTPKEFDLLAMLCKEPGKVLTHRQLLEGVWGSAYAEQNHYLRIFMKNIRHKLEDSPTQPQILLTESGVGYRIKPDEN